MPPLLLINGFKFFFYANEHEPKHIHVSKGDEFAKIELLQIHVIKSHMKPKDLKMALKIVELHKDEFERQWDEYFNQR